MIGGPPLIGNGAERLLHALHPGDQPAGTRSFPPRHHPPLIRAAGGESVPEWFRRCVKQDLGGDVGRLELEQNTGAFATVHWVNGTLLTAASLQFIVSEGGTLAEAYAGAELPLHYFRLDLDAQTLGGLFSHPFPHVHVVPAEGGRFGPERPVPGNAVTDFIEFIYRNFHHDQWFSWAESVWDRDWVGRGRDPISNPFIPLALAFEEAQWPIIRRHQTDIQRLRTILNDAKDSAFPLRVPAEDAAILAYP
jgi:hypothetical protein